jgi:hypothetical protein
MRQAPAPFGHPEWMPWISLQEEFAGILSIVPLCLAGIVLPLSMLRRHLAVAVKAIVFMLWTAALTMLFCICGAGAIGMRYHIDYCPELLVSALFVCLWIASRAPRRWQQFAVLALTVAGCAWGSVCTVAVSINSYNHSLRTRNPETFKRLVSLFGGDPEAIRYPVRQLEFEATILPAPKPLSMTEAIVSSGGLHAGDVVSLEYTDKDRARFAVQHWGTPLVFGHEVALDRGVPHQLRFEYLRTDHELLTVSLDGRIVLSREGEIHFTAPAEVAVGQDKTGASLAPFSGQLWVKDGVTLIFGE